MKIFISHSREDNSFVNIITNILDTYQIEYWIDRDQIYNKISDLDKAIKEGINNSTHFLLLWSKNARGSEYVEKEIKNAISKGDTLTTFSFQLDDTEYPDDIKKFKNCTREKINANSGKEQIRNFIFGKIAKDTSFISQIRILKDKIRYDFEHYSSYKDLKENISVNAFKKIDTYHEFVSQRFRLLGIEKEGEDILKFVFNQIKHKDKNGKLIPIVGDYGSGKSLFSLYLLYQLCENIEDDSLVPIHVQLGKLKEFDPANELSFTECLGKYVEKEYKITDRFLDNIKNGKIIFILDAFDEMYHTIDSSIIDKSLEYIDRLSQHGNYVILTSRHTYLTKYQEMNFITRNELVKILDFDDKQIEELVDKKIANHKITIPKSEIMKTLSKPEIKKFISKPLFLHIVCDKYYELQNLPILNPASIFEMLTKEWIMHDVHKYEQLSPDDKKALEKKRHRISESLALLANKIGDKQSISLGDLKKQIDDEFITKVGYQVTDDDLSKFYRDAKDTTFLIKEKSEGDQDTFSFIHRAVVEYLVARRIVNCINEKDYDSILQYSQEIKTDETYEFIEYIVDIEWAIKPHAYPRLNERLDDDFKLEHNFLDKTYIIHKAIAYAKSKSNSDNPSLSPEIGNLVNILYSISNFAKFSYKEIANSNSNQRLDLSCCNLSGLRIPYANLSHADLSHADLSHADLSHADLSHADLSGTILYSADLSGSKLSEAKLINSKLMNTDLTKCDLAGADLSLANRSVGRDLIENEPSCSVNLSNSDLTNVNFENADLSTAFILNLIAFEGIKGNSDSDFSGSVITDKGFYKVLKKFTKKLPTLFYNRQKLAGRVVDTCTTSRSEGEELVRISKLPNI
jgi:uncharacterized protein YjbI with pentapeptide repeats/archaellum biogenesis ATPase FlaH